jgi:hypothetical protein
MRRRRTGGGGEGEEEGVSNSRKRGTACWGVGEGKYCTVEENQGELLIHI